MVEALIGLVDHGGQFGPQVVPASDGDYHPFFFFPFFFYFFHTSLAQSQSLFSLCTPTLSRPRSLFCLVLVARAVPLLQLGTSSSTYTSLTSECGGC